MSALARRVGDVDGFHRPSLSRLTWAVLIGEIQAAVVLWVAGIVLDILAIAPLGGGNEWVWLPWPIDSAWALVGAVGWGYVVCSIVAVFVGQSIERRGFERPAPAWLLIAIATSGYGSMAVGRTPGAHIAAAVLAGALLTRLIAFRADGSARPWRWVVSPRMRGGAILVALVVALSYSALHPFAADGSGGTYTTGTTYAHRHQFEIADIGLSRSRVPVRITSVTFTGPGVVHLRVSAVELNLDGPGQPGARLTRLPYRLPANRQLWISAEVQLRSCGFVKLNTLQLHYTVQGIATEQTIPLQSPLTMRCRG